MEASQTQTNQRLTTMEAAQGVTNQRLTSMEKAINNIEKTLHFQLRSVARSVNSSLRGGDQFIDLLPTDMGTFPMNNPTKLSDFPKMPLSEFKDVLSSYGIPPKDAEDEES